MGTSTALAGTLLLFSTPGLDLRLPFTALCSRAMLNLAVCSLTARSLSTGRGLSELAHAARQAVAPPHFVCPTMTTTNPGSGVVSTGMSWESTVTERTVFNINFNGVLEHGLGRYVVGMELAEVP
jgi:hypothetical protein